MKIVSVVGARPNFMKIAPFINEIKSHNKVSKSESVEHILVHTGQHYDDRMSGSFFESLSIPQADINLGVGSGTHSEQVGHTMIEFEKAIKRIKPDWVVVVGDVNATLACAITAKKERIKVCHIEAGLRSFDMSMPEEINRIVTDRLSDLLLVPDKQSMNNLLKEGVTLESIKFVGNIMIDTLESNREKASKLLIKEIISDNRVRETKGSGVSAQSTEIISIYESGYALLTLHRPSNVDSREILDSLVAYICDEVTKEMPVIWTLHPRTMKMLKHYELWDKIAANNKIVLLHPIGYHELLKLNLEAAIVLTDSGGLQGESSVLGSPCLILRCNTEWTVTLAEHGGNSKLVGNDVHKIRKAYNEILKSDSRSTRPELWDGKTAGRCLKAILQFSREH